MKELLLAAVALGAEISPVVKVVNMLESMHEQGKKNKHEEEVLFATYSQWCSDTELEKSTAVKDGKARAELLDADILKYTSDYNESVGRVQELDVEIAAKEQDMIASKKVRETERADYQVTHKDYTESVDALARAIIVLKQQDYNRKQAKSLLEESAALTKLLTPEHKKVLNLFFQQDPEIASMNDVGTAAGYEFRSGSVIEMLEKLKVKFEEERSAFEKDETNKRHSFQMLHQDLTAQIEQKTELRTNAATSGNKKKQASADAKGELDDVNATLKDDESSLSEITTTCKIKSDDFAERQKVRAEEIEAIEKAIEILSPMAQQIVQKGASLLQFGSRHRHLRAEPAVEQSQNNMMVQRFLLARSRDLHSPLLSALATQMNAPDDPFEKVKKMINDLIVRLMAEANEEADHKGWCEKELSINKTTRDEKTKQSETLRSEIDQLQANIAQNMDQVTELQAEIKEITQREAEAMEHRKAEKEENQSTIKDAQDAQVAVEKALTVLKEFYSAKSMFVQQSSQTRTLLQKQAPKIFGEGGFKGMGGESTGVLGLLEVIVSDYARLETETAAAENQADKKYLTLMTSFMVDLAQKKKDVEHKNSQKQNQEHQLMERKTDLEGTQKELDAAMEYYDKLKPTCIDAGVSYDERVARRKEEIESLQEALRILDGESIA